MYLSTYHVIRRNSRQIKKSHTFSNKRKRNRKPYFHIFPPFLCFSNTHIYQTSFLIPSKLQTELKKLNWIFHPASLLRAHSTPEIFSRHLVRVAEVKSRTSETFFEICIFNISRERNSSFVIIYEAYRRVDSTRVARRRRCEPSPQPCRPDHVDSILIASYAR